MAYSIVRKELTPQPVLVARCRVERSGIASTIAEALPRVFACAAQHEIALTGLPFTRYVEMGPEFVTMEPGMRISRPVASSPAVELPMIIDTLPGGPAATTIHTGPYEGLPDAYAAIQQWIEAQGITAAGAPWECYITDPASVPEPADWKTEVFFPLARS
ncbi:MAG TPA: GyrI-like domain-containing protein [Bryobacteraceae bacterium]|nr:GyrI-like domain-containing protein [Bryobacteraceae bacterium]